MRHLPFAQLLSLPPPSRLASTRESQPPILQLQRFRSCSLISYRHESLARGEIQSLSVLQIRSIKMTFLVPYLIRYAVHIVPCPQVRRPYSFFTTFYFNQPCSNICAHLSFLGLYCRMTTSCILEPCYIAERRAVSHARRPCFGFCRDVQIPCSPVSLSRTHFGPCPPHAFHLLRMSSPSNLLMHAPDVIPRSETQRGGRYIVCVVFRAGKECCNAPITLRIPVHDLRSDVHVSDPAYPVQCSPFCVFMRLITNPDCRQQITFNLLLRALYGICCIVTPGRFSSGDYLAVWAVMLAYPRPRNAYNATSARTLPIAPSNPCGTRAPSYLVVVTLSLTRDHFGGVPKRHSLRHPLLR